MTPLEVSSIGLALTSLTTLWFWVRKPLDVRIPTIIHLNKEIPATWPSYSETSTQEIDPHITPLAHVEPRTYVSRKWSSTLLSLIIRVGLQKSQIDRIPNDRDPQIPGLKYHIILGIATALFASIHFVDWNFPFPTHIELWIWRSNCILMWALLAIYGTSEVIICSREKYENMGLDTCGGYKLRWPRCLWFFVPAGTYLLARICLIVVVFTSMRALPTEAFIDVKWAELLPHV